MDGIGQWLALGLAVLALVLAGYSMLRVRWLVRRTELQLRALAQRESWQRRTV